MTVKHLYKNSFFVIISLLIVSCSGVKDVRQARILDAYELPSSASVKPIALTKIASKMRRGTNIGVLYVGAHCNIPVPLKWRSSRTVSYDINDLEQVFHEELESKGYEIVGSEDNLFEGRDYSAAELMIAAKIDNLKFDGCSVRNDGMMYGSIFMEIEWQLYDPFKKELLGSVKTEGSAKIEVFTDEGYLIMFEDAFAVATNNLLAKKSFSKLVTSSSKKKD